jgi:nitrate reductase gamma subunit
VDSTYSEILILGSIVMFLTSLGIFIGAWRNIKNGSIEWLSRNLKDTKAITKKDNPFHFWLKIVLQIFGGILLVGGGFIAIFFA